jgi:hypothetical protein
MPRAAPVTSAFRPSSVLVCMTFLPFLDATGDRIA